MIFYEFYALFKKQFVYIKITSYLENKKVTFIIRTNLCQLRWPDTFGQHHMQKMDPLLAAGSSGEKQGQLPPL